MASIAPDHALIPPNRANPRGCDFRERQAPDIAAKGRCASDFRRMDFKNAAGKEVAALQARQQYVITLATQRCCQQAPAERIAVIPRALFRRRPSEESSSASRVTAGAAGFLAFSQQSARPAR
jgi:hypothetical protein